MRFLAAFLILAVALSGCAAETASPPLPVPSGPAPALTSTAARPSTLAAATPVPQPTATRRVPTVGVHAADLRGTKINFWFPASGELEKEVLAQIADFNRGNVWGILVEGRAFTSSTQLEEQVLASQISGGLPQAAAAPLEMLLSWHGQGPLIAPLDPYVQDAEWGLTAQEIADFWPSIWQAGQVGGRHWGIPDGLNLQVIYYNQTWAEALGFSKPPATPADFRAQACAAMKANVADDNPENDGTGGWIVTNDALTLESWRRAFGGDSLPVEEGPAYTFNSPPTVAAFTFLRKLLDDHCAWNARNPNPYPYLAGRQALFYSGSLLDLPFQERAMTFAKSTDRWTILAYPAETKTPVVVASGFSQAVFLSTPVEQLAAWLFLRNLMLPRVQARLAAAGDLLPSRASAVTQMADYRQSHPQWAVVAAWQNELQPAPRLASWRTVRRVLEDAAWQIFSPITTPTGIPAVLAELDSMTTEILKVK
jgi:multiple sugar transport system substrate-binding protein